MARDDSHRNHRKRDSRGYTERRINTRNTKDSFLIVCEGKKTEPLYLKSFKVRSADVRIIGEGKNTISLVKRTMDLMSQDSYDQVWCVFDRDSFPNGNFNQAIQLAKQHNIHVAYSNESFELWFVLHFEYLQSALTRHQYNSKLSHHLGQKYDKADERMFNKLEEIQQTAISNAKRLYDFYPNHTNPERNKPCTTVHLLVEELIKHR